jgi:hypothetical protein
MSPRIIYFHKEQQLFMTLIVEDWRQNKWQTMNIIRKGT